MVEESINDWIKIVHMYGSLRSAESIIDCYEEAGRTLDADGIADQLVQIERFEKQVREKAYHEIADNEIRKLTSNFSAGTLEDLKHKYSKILRRAEINSRAN